MSAATSSSRKQPWLESLGDWAWPGRAAESLPQPPSWVPASPPRLQPLAAGAGAPSSLPLRARLSPRRVLLAALLSALLAVAGALVVRSPLEAELGLRRQPPPVAAFAAGSAAADVSVPLPTLVAVSHDGAGSRIDRASFSSWALGSDGSFLVYLPPGYASTSERYPVIYLLHGQNGHAEAFLEVGVQQTLDRLIGAGAIPPMIAVMIQDAPTMNNWRNIGRRHSGTYVVEVQELVDRMLPTIRARSARAIAGASMGGFGAMHAALSNPTRFSVVESWLGYFNHLEGELSAARPIIARRGLHAFVYGAVADPVALPEEDPAFAAELRAAGAQAHSAVYPGGHSLGKVRAHLEAGLLFAGRSLRAAQRREAAEVARRRALLARARQAAAVPPAPARAARAGS